MSRSLRAGVATLVLTLGVAITPLGGTVPAGAADAAPNVLGYTLLLGSGDFECDLATVDWATGAVTDLPAPTSADACAMDLAFAPDGTVYGLDLISFLISRTNGPELVTYAADGTASRVPLELPAGYDFLNILLNPMSGIAVDAAGTIYVLFDALDVDYTTCLPIVGGDSVPALDDSSGASACLFTVAPSTGAMTLVGPSTLTFGERVELLTIASDAMRTTVDSSPLKSVPSATFRPSAESTLLWSTVDPATGEVTQSLVNVDTKGGAYDALRSGPTVYTLVQVEGDDHPWTGTVDPTTGAVTPIARMSVLASRLSGMSLAVAPIPEPDVPKFTG